MAKEKTKQLNVYFPEAMATYIEALADKERRSVSSQIVMMVEKAKAMDEAEAAAKYLRA